MDGAGTLVKDDLSVCASSRLYSWALFYPIALCLSLMHSLIFKDRSVALLYTLFTAGF